METIHRGSCACGQVRFEVTLDLANGASRCNCGLCIKIHQSSSMVKPSAFRVTEGEAHLRRFQRHEAYAMYRHFCERCATHLYGTGNLPELGGDFVAVNVQCLDDVEIDEVTIRYWDGRHEAWDAGARETPWPILKAG